MCAFRGVARLVLQSLLKTGGLNWVAVVPPFFPYNNSCLFFPKDRYSAQYVVWKSCRKMRRGETFPHSSKELEIAQITPCAMWTFSQFGLTLKLLVRGPCGHLAVSFSPPFLALSLSTLYHYISVLNLPNQKNHLNVCWDCSSQSIYPPQISLKTRISGGQPLKYVIFKTPQVSLILK